MVGIAARNGRRDLSRFRFTFLASIVSLLLTACAGQEPVLQQINPPADVVLIVPTPEPGPLRPQLEVAQLIALKDISQRDLVARLGEPDFTRRDPPAEIWQYRSASCVLDVFLYPDDGELKVLHTATRDRARLKVPENTCSPFAPTLSASTGS
jgi:hypothetical protein